MKFKLLIQEIKNFYDSSRAIEELGDMLQSNRLYHKKDHVLELIKQITQREDDSFVIRKMGRFLSDILNEFKIKHNIKEQKNVEYRK